MSTLKIALRTLIVIASLVIVLAAFMVGAWQTKQSANAYCDGTARTARISVSFMNTEPVDSGMAMDVVAEDMQSHKTANLGTIQPQATANGMIDTGLTQLGANKVKFHLKWTDGSSGTDTREQSYAATANCAPPVVTEEPPVETEEPPVVTEEPPVLTQEPPTTVVTHDPPPDHIIMCETPNTLLLPDGWYDFYGRNVEVKTEERFGSKVWFMLSTGAFKESKIEQVANGLFSVSIVVDRDPMTGEIYHYGCALVPQEPKIQASTPTIIPCGTNNEFCPWIAKAVTRHDITWETLAYCVGNPDPAVTLTNVSLDDIQSGWVTVNGEWVAPITFWTNKHFENQVSGRWEYSNIQLGDQVKEMIRVNGLPIEIDVQVVTGDECGNPAIAAMIGPNDELIVYPGHSPMDVAQITQFEGTDAELMTIWWDAHIAAQRGEAYFIESDTKLDMARFN